MATKPKEKKAKVQPKQIEIQMIIRQFNIRYAFLGFSN